MTDIVGVVLAGGLATRMGGGDKCLKELVAGVTLLDVVMGRLKRQVGEVAINANGEPSRFAKFDCPVLADDVKGYAGPLAGVLAGLEWAADFGATHVLSVAGDTPFFPDNLNVELSAAKGVSGLSIAASHDEDGKLWRQPTFGLWPVALKDDLRHALCVDGVRKIVIWTQKHQAGQAVFSTENGIDPFFNVNTPDDLAAAQKIASERGLL
jgi:molybdenum cofactor guanylyltransferase